MGPRIQSYWLTKTLILQALQSKMLRLASSADPTYASAISNYAVKSIDLTNPSLGVKIHADQLQNDFERGHDGCTCCSTIIKQIKNLQRA